MPKNKNISVLVFVVFVLLFPGFCAAIEHTDAQIQTQKFVLENGLTVLISPMPLSPTVSVYGLVKTGSATEGKYMGTGISHFLEHMLFKGTDKRAAGEISKEVHALGGEINASTSFDYTIYTLTLPASAFDQGLDILSDMLMNSKFDSGEIQREREVVYGEMRLYKDNPDRHLSQMVFDTVYKQHPYGIPVIGYEELLRELDREDFLDYYQTHYSPNNIVLSIAGNVQSREILPKIRETFKDFGRQPLVIRNLVQEPAQISRRLSVSEYPTDLTRVSLAYSGVSLRDSDMFALDVLAMILGQGESSRLYKEIMLNKKLARSVSASNFTPFDRGVFEIEMVLDKANLDAALGAVKEQIRLIVQKGVKADELQKIKRQIVSEHIFGCLTSDSVADRVALDEALTGDYDFSAKYVETIQKITVKDIKRVALKYLLDEKLSTVILAPKGETVQAEKSQPDNLKSDIQKAVLGNGLTILLRENHTAPVVSVNLVIGGGSGQETAENNGISQLTSRLLLSGTKTHSAGFIAESVESRGGSLGPFSGRNSFGLSFNGLARDTDFALDLLADVITNSTFFEGELTRHKRDIATALMSQDDNIRVVTSRHLRESLFLTHPFRLDGLGTLKSIESLQRNDVENFYKKYVVPGNMVLSVFGDIDSERVLKNIKKNFDALAKNDAQILTFQESPPDQMREKTVRLEKNQAMLMIGFQGVDVKNKDRFSMEVLGAVLGSPFNGRIFQTIRDEFGEAYTLGGGFVPARDVGMVSFFVQTTDGSVEKVKSLLIDIIADIRQNGVEAEELAQMKTYLKGSTAMSLQTDASLGFVSAIDELMGNGYDYYRAYDSYIDAVTAEDIKRLANEYLDINRAAIVVSRPTEDIIKNAPAQKPLVKPSFPADIH